MNGTKSGLTREVEKFGRLLDEHLDVPLTFWDERLSSVQARRIMIAMNEKPSRKKEKIDRIAAVLILQSYMDYQSEKNGSEEENI